MDTFLKNNLIDTHILHVSLNHPEALNVLNMKLMHELHDILINAQKEQAIKAVLLTGEGKAFCAGADIKELARCSFLAKCAHILMENNCERQYRYFICRNSWIRW